jgi:hypothetical protein
MPEGWEYVTSDPDHDDAWGLAVQYKELRSKFGNEFFVRVRVIRVAGVWWVIQRTELRDERAAA